MTPEQLADILRASYERGKAHAIVVVAEGAKNDAEALEKYFHEHKQALGFELRATRLGHVQRGGAPGAFDRLLATRLGAGATKALAENQTGVLIGLNKGEITRTPLAQAVSTKKPLDRTLLTLAQELDQ
jgi:6-phosphofructokinase 1